MINNRQNGRRRGRGGGGPRPNGPPSAGNRQDNRSRGNAAQLHEKFKAMARDAQMAGDRVQTEYYLQFADHYFRVLNENRPRFEEPRRGQGDFMSDDDEDGDESGYGAEGGEEQDERPQQQQQQRPEREFRPRREYREDQPRGEREARPEREQRSDREQRPEREPRSDRDQRPEREPREYREPREVRAEGGEQPERAPRDETVRRPRRRERQPDDGSVVTALPAMEPQGDADAGRLSLDVLPPAISSDVAEIKPRRRTRRPTPEGDADIAPAA